MRKVMREHLSPVTESPSITALGRSISTLSVGLGLFGVPVVFSILAGNLSWFFLPGVLLLIAGGVLGAVSWFIVVDIYLSRRYGLWAAVATALGAALVGLAIVIS